MSTQETRRLVLQRMWDRDRDVSPERLVADAKSPTHEMHSDFRWDVAAAAYEHWLEQARGFIRTVKIERVEGPVRALVHVPREVVRVTPELQHLEHRSGIYAPAQWVGEQPDVKAAVLMQMQREWVTLRRKWEAYEEFWELLTASVAVPAG